MPGGFGGGDDDDDEDEDMRKGEKELYAGGEKRYADPLRPSLPRLSSVVSPSRTPIRDKAGVGADREE